MLVLIVVKMNVVMKISLTWKSISFWDYFQKSLSKTIERNDVYRSHECDAFEFRRRSFEFVRERKENFEST